MILTPEIHIILVDLKRIMIAASPFTPLDIDIEFVYLTKLLINYSNITKHICLDTAQSALRPIGRGPPMADLLNLLIQMQ